jgi:hypothetical protein
MKISLLKSLRSYLGSQEQHYLNQQKEQEWLLREVTASIAATITQPKETRRALALLLRHADGPSGNDLAEFLPSLLPSFLSRPITSSPSVEEEQGQTKPHQPEQQQDDEDQELPAASDKRRPASALSDDVVDDESPPPSSFDSWQIASLRQQG